jgi:hypothetical protein
MYLRTRDGEAEKADDLSGVVPLLEAILNLAGCNGDKASGAIGKSYERLAAIGEVVTKLRKAIRVDITSSDLHLLGVSHDTVFDATKMEDEDRSAVPGGVVFCATALGLEEIEKSGQGGGERQRKILLKPKVTLLASVLP